MQVFDSEKFMEKYLRGYNLEILDNCICKPVAIATLCQIISMGFDDDSSNVSRNGLEVGSELIDGREVKIYIDRACLDVTLDAFYGMIHMSTLAVPSYNPINHLSSSINAIREKRTKHPDMYHQAVTYRTIYRYLSENLLANELLGQDRLKTKLDTIITEVFGSYEGFTTFRRENNMAEVKLRDFTSEYYEKTANLLVGSGYTLEAGTTTHRLTDGNDELNKLKKELKELKDLNKILEGENIALKDNVGDLESKIVQLEYTLTDKEQIIEALDNTSLSHKDMELLRDENTKLNKDILDAGVKIMKLEGTIEEYGSYKKVVTELNSKIIPQEAISKVIENLRKFEDVKNIPFVNCLADLYVSSPAEVSATIVAYLTHVKHLEGR